MNAQKTGSLIAAIRKEQNRTQQDLANDWEYQVQLFQNGNEVSDFQMYLLLNH